MSSPGPLLDKIGKGQLRNHLRFSEQGCKLAVTERPDRSPGRPRISREVEQLIVRMAEENRDWGYDRIAGALANLGYEVCDQTVGNVLQRHARSRPIRTLTCGASGLSASRSGSVCPPSTNSENLLWRSGPSVSFAVA